VFGDLWGVVRDADFVVKELAAHVTDESHEFAGVLEQSALAVELADAFGQRTQKRLEISCPPLVVRLFLLRHASA
jgi:hypothetical protein